MGEEAEKAGSGEAQNLTSQVAGLGPGPPLPRLVACVDSPQLRVLTVKHQDCAAYSSACL